MVVPSWYALFKQFKTLRHFCVEGCDLDFSGPKDLRTGLTKIVDLAIQKLPANQSQPIWPIFAVSGRVVTFEYLLMLLVMLMLMCKCLQV